MQVIRQQGDSITALDAKISGELDGIKKDVHGSASQVKKKLKTESQYKWRFEGNKVQFLLNSELLEEIDQVIWAIDNSKFEYAKETVTSVSTKLKKRNKLIKIADSSEGGWETVRQYETNPVASDSDDESKINKAESRAIKKKKNNASKKKSKPAPDTKLIDSQFGNMQRPFRGPPSWVGDAPAFPWSGGSADRFQRKQSGACFACGSFQHWRSECPFYPDRTKPAKSKAE